MKKIIKFIISILVCQLAGIIGSIFTVSSVGSWYLELNKPVFNPPSYLFGPVWIFLYFLMGLALYFVWVKKDVKNALILFFVHLFLNSLWSVLFFGLKLVFVAFLEIILLWIFILLVMIKFYKFDKRSCYLLIPYILWVSFALILNFSIYILN
ncbi:MAG: tryptophan-rich sensory protein [Nanoarchaeota archaeon]|nr:tryptophan-rich sensory protein [Nanoarchaeota archaeon]